MSRKHSRQIVDTARELANQMIKLQEAFQQTREAMGKLESHFYNASDSKVLLENDYPFQSELSQITGNVERWVHSSKYALAYMTRYDWQIVYTGGGISLAWRDFVSIDGKDVMVQMDGEDVYVFRDPKDHHLLSYAEFTMRHDDDIAGYEADFQEFVMGVAYDEDNHSKTIPSDHILDLFSQSTIDELENLLMNFHEKVASLD